VRETPLFQLFAQLRKAAARVCTGVFSQIALPLSRHQESKQAKEQKQSHNYNSAVLLYFTYLYSKVIPNYQKSTKNEECDEDTTAADSIGIFESDNNDDDQVDNQQNQVAVTLASINITREESRRTLPRSFFLLIASVLGVIANIALSVSSYHQIGCFVFGVVLSGISFGMVWPLFVLIIEEMFGVDHVAANCTFCIGFSSAVGTLVLSKLLVTATAMHPQMVYTITAVLLFTCAGTSAFLMMQHPVIVNHDEKKHEHKYHARTSKEQKCHNCFKLISRPRYARNKRQ